jgi:23S rRNA pseudouridine955/2504/2580 synthase
MNGGSKVQIVEIGSERVGQRVDNYLIRHAKGVPRSRVYKAIRKGEVRVNKKRVKAEYKLKHGDMLRIPPFRLIETSEISIPAKTTEWLLTRIIYESADLMILNKPYGMPVHGGTNCAYGVINVLRQAKSEYQSLELVHRLDKDTSGCLLIAKSRSMLTYLHNAIRKNEIDKEYICLVKGHCDFSFKKVDLPLQKNVLSSGERLVRVDSAGKDAMTEFTVTQQFSLVTLLKARLITGRTHQIRVHLQYLGHPIAADSKYGDKQFNKHIQTVGLKRMFLHASQLKFRLPEQKKAITVTAPLDDELQKCLQNLD